MRGYLPQKCKRAWGRLARFPQAIEPGCLAKFPGEANKGQAGFSIAAARGQVSGSTGQGTLLDQSVVGPDGLRRAASTLLAPMILRHRPRLGLASYAACIFSDLACFQALSPAEVMR